MPLHQTSTRQIALLFNARARLKSEPGRRLKSSQYNYYIHLQTLISLVTTHLVEDGKGLGCYHVTKNRSVDRTSDVKIYQKTFLETTSKEKLTLINLTNVSNVTTITLFLIRTALTNPVLERI